MREKITCYVEKLVKGLSLISIWLLVLMILGCGNNMYKSSEGFSITKFPRDKQGYPKCNVVIINGTEFSIKDLSKSLMRNNLDQEIKLQDIREGDRIEVILPQYLPINLWSIEEKETIDFINYNKKDLTVQQAVEGRSAFVQKFIFTLENDTSILFKWSNVQECGKSFDEKEKEYLLKISIA